MTTIDMTARLEPDVARKLQALAIWYAPMSKNALINQAIRQMYEAELNRPEINEDASEEPQA